jgi:hypothetical protein
MSFDDWLSEAKPHYVDVFKDVYDFKQKKYIKVKCGTKLVSHEYIYVSFVSKGTSANSGKIKLIKHEHEIFKLRDEDITIKKYL